MQAVANNPAFAKKVGVPQSVGKEFTMKKGMADKAGRAMHKKGADAMGRAMKKAAMGGPLVNRQSKEKKMAKGGSASKRADGCAKKGKTDTKMVAMKKGGYMKGGSC